MSRILGGVVVFIWLFGASGLAEAQTSAPSPAQRPYEEAFARGDLRECLRLGIEDARGLPGFFEDPAAETDAEILLLRIHHLLHYDPAAVVEGLGDCHATGWIATRAALARQAALADLGRFAEAEAEAERLGFITRFLIAGPFDNERGAGQSAVLAPEQAPVDPEAVFDGKDRQVRWRSLAMLPQGIVLDLADLIVPKEQSLAYLACTITSPADQWVALGIGNSSFCRAWIDGKQVFERDTSRDDAIPDQERCIVRLHKGPNELLLKVGVVTGPFRISVRIADGLGGPPPEGVTVSGAPEAFTRRRPESRPEPKALPTPRGFARSSMEERVKKDDATADDLGRWARLRLLLRLDDRAHPETPAFTARAVALAPKDFRARDAHARALRRHTDIAAEKEDNARVQALRDLLEIAPDHVPSLQELGRTYADDLHHVELGIGYLERALAKNPKAPDTLMRLAHVRDQMGQDGRAELLMRAGAENGGVQDKVAFAGWLIQRRRFREGAEAVAAVREIAPGAVHVLRVAESLKEETGDLPGAMLLLRALMRRQPTDDEPRLRLAGLLDGQEDAAGALAVLEDLLQIAPDLVEARRRAAILADRLGQKEVALDHLAHALTIEPGNAKMRRLEGWLSGHEKSFEDGFALDAEAIVAKAPDFKSNPDNQPYRYLMRRAIVRVNPDGTSGVYRHFIAQILNQRGVEDLDRVYASLDSREQRSRFKIARLFRAGAPPVEADRPYPSLADFPALQPGDVIEWAYRVDDLRQSYFGNYFGFDHKFQAHDLAAVDRSELILLLPKNRTFKFHARNADLKSETIPAPDFLPDYEGRRYVLENIEAVVGERAMPDSDEFVPSLEVSTYQSWDEFAGWWWNLIKKQYDVNDAMKAKLKEILANAKTREEKIRAIYDFVVTDIRYVAWEFGVHGYKPYRASAIFDRRFGDCKDKALVMNSLLKEAGIEGYPVLIRLDEPRSAEDHSLALVQHFNHCIVAIPEEDGSIRFLDGTAEYHEATDLPDGDRGASVVVVRDGRAVQAKIPVGPPEQNLNREELQVALLDDGKATVNYKARLTGHHAVGTRSRFINEADRKEELTEVVNRRYGQGTLGNIEFSKLSDLTVPVTMAYTFEVGDLLNRDGDRARIRPLWSEFDWTSLSVTEKRRFDIMVGSPSKTVTTAEITLSPKWKIATMPEDTVIEEPFARYELKRSAADGKVRLERTMTILEPRIKAEDYQVFRRFVTRVAEADRETVTLEAVK
jgi:tetratricopeptide (TPR) repeat protein